MRVKLDENLPTSLGEVLVAHGHQVDTVLGEDLGGHPDPEVAAAVKTDGRFLITLDKGFGDIRAYPPGTHPGILVLRLADESPGAVRQAVTAVLDHHRLDDLVGTVIVFHRGRLRIRLLGLGRPPRLVPPLLGRRRRLLPSPTRPQTHRPPTPAARLGRHQSGALAQPDAPRRPRHRRGVIPARPAIAPGLHGLKVGRRPLRLRAP